MPLPVTSHGFYILTQKGITLAHGGLMVWNETDFKQFADVLFLSVVSFIRTT